MLKLRKKGLGFFLLAAMILSVFGSGVSVSAQTKDSRAIICCDNMSTYNYKEYSNTGSYWCSLHSNCKILSLTTHTGKRCRNCGATLSKNSVASFPHSSKGEWPQ